MGIVADGRPAAPSGTDSRPGGRSIRRPVSGGVIGTVARAGGDSIARGLPAAAARPLGA